jgi:hypothetical protein
MASPSDLISLATVKAFLNVTDPSKDDATLGMMITQVSRAIISNVNRNSFLPRSFNEIRNGDGKQKIMLGNYPVLSITSLTVDGVLILPAPALIANGPVSNGYVLEPADDEPPGAPQNLYLRGTYFNRGIQNVLVTYPAGYQIIAEASVVPASPFQLTTLQPYGVWGSDMGVTKAGVAMTKVITVPITGQYSVSPIGVYTFAAADTGQSVAISYGFIPADLANAAMEWIADRWKYRERIGVASKSLGGQETVSFRISDSPTFVKLVLQQYTRTVTL